MAPYPAFRGSRNQVVITALVLLALATPSLQAAHPPAPHGTGGAVASSERDATDAGLEMLRSGGNAADAAVAVALALAVVHPEAGNLGGGGFAVVRLDSEVAALDFREAAPAAASRDMYLGDDGEPVPEKSLVGPLAAGVPGSPAGLHDLHRRFGALPWKRVVEPAIRLAEEGFVVSARSAASLSSRRELLQRFPETAAVWVPGGRCPEAGDSMRLPQLAATLRDYAQRGPAAITTGPAAAAIEAAARRHGGVLTADDLAAYRPQWRQPIRFSAYGWEVASMPLPSSGGIILAQTCGMLERLRWSDQPRFGANRAHLLAEAWRRTFADRFLLGDPRTARADSPQLLAPAWLDRRAREISVGAATSSQMVQPWAADPGSEHPETTHIAVVDGDGGSVALTTTLNGLFGCGLLVTRVGFLLNNEMDDFAAVPGGANLFGLVQGEANAVGPGKRMLSSMTPTVAWRGDDVLVVGGRGGSRIPTATGQVLLNVIVDDDPLQTAVNRPRIHHQWLPDRIVAEPDALAPETEAELRRRGHDVVASTGSAKVNAVRVVAGEGVEAAADPRGPGVAAVVRPAPGS